MILEVVVSDTEWEIVQADINLATRQDNTYVVLEQGFSTDISSSTPSVPITLQVGMFTPNTNPPMLEDGVVNLQSRLLRLLFSEGVDTSTLVLTGISISFTNRMSGLRQTHTLTGGNAGTGAGTTNQVSVLLAQVDYDVILSAVPDPSDVLLSIAASTVLDGSGMPNLLQQNVSISQFVIDNQPPSIIGFEIDLNSGEFIISFSELIVSSSIDYSQIFIRGDGSASVEDGSLSLGGSTFISESQTLFFESVVNSSLMLGTLNMINGDVDVCTAVENCFMVWGNSSFNDTSGNFAIQSLFSIQVTAITTDTTSPRILSVSIDLSDGVLNLTFSEPVSVDSLQVSSLTLTDGASQQEAIAGSVVVVGDSGSAAFSTDISITLNSSSLNFAKTLRGPRLAAQRNVTSDANGNPLVGVSIVDALLPSMLIADQFPPFLLEFVPGVPSSMEIVLVFDEPVDTTRWNGNELFMTLQVSAGDFTYTGFTAGVLSPTVSDRVTYTFSVADFTATFSSQYAEAYDSGTIILRADTGLIEDVGGNVIGSTDPIVYTTQPIDVTPPTLEGFDLDMDTGRIQLTFSEPVNVQSMSRQLQFVDASDFQDITQEYPLVEGSTLVSSRMGPLPEVEFEFSTTDLNALKANTQLCSSISNTFVVTLANLAQDRSGNIVQASTSGIPVLTYTPDTSVPRIERVDLDLNREELTMQFSEPILTGSLNLSLLQITASASLQTGTGLNGILSNPENFTILTLELPVITLNSIKFDQSTCTSQDNCYFHHPMNAYTDTSGNIAPGNSGMLIESFTADVTSPQLISFDLDLNTGTLCFTFNEPITPVTFNSASLTFVSLTSTTNLTYSPSDAFVQSVESLNTVVLLNLGPLSLNQVKLLDANSPGNVALAISASATSDLALNPNMIVPIEESFPLSATSYIPDTTVPVLLSFTPASPNSNDITFVFSEFVDGNAFDQSQLVMELVTRQGVTEYSDFTGGTITSALQTDELTFTFSQADFNSTLSAQFSEAVSGGSVSLLVSTGLVTDLGGNLLQAISTPLVFTTDSTRPTLLSYTLDLNMGLLDLSFSEPVNIQAVVGVARIQDAASSPNTVVSLTQNGTLSPAASASDTIVVQLGTTDLNNIKTSQGTGTSEADTFLALGETFAVDVSGNLLSPGTEALQVSSLIPDTSRPSLVSFTVDIEQGRVVLLFSEHIVTATLDSMLIFLTGMPQSQPSGYHLADSAYSGPGFSEDVTLVLSLNLLNQIKSDLQVCSSRANCFIFIADGALRDVSGNLVIPSTTGTLVESEPVPDSTRPSLLSYVMDLNSGLIDLTFSEPVLVQGFSPSGITAQASGLSQGLGDSTVISSQSFDTILRLSAGSNLLNQLKVLDSSGTIMASVSSNTVTDTSSLSVVAIPPSNPLSPSTFVPDTTPPILLQFVPSSGQLGLTLVFDEFVSPASIERNLLSFRLKNRNGQIDYTDLTSALISPDNSDRVTLTFPASETRFTDSDFLESYALSFSEGSICLNLATAFVSDVTGNLYSGELLAVYTNTSDTVRPELASFTLNLNTSTLNLTFTEPVNVLSVAGNVRFQNSASDTPTSVYNLMRGNVTTSQGASADVVTISMYQVDVMNLMNIPSLATSIANTYLLLLEAFAVDFGGNFLNDSLAAVQASEVTQVIRGTMVVGFDLDLDSDIMTIEFDRDVNVSTFNASQVMLTNVSSMEDMERADVQLGRVEVLSPFGSVVTLFRFVLQVDDTVSIKSSTLCYEVENCFASFAAELVRDTTGNSTVPRVLQVRNLFSDVTPPRLVAFTVFDLNQGQFTLIFSEPVNGSSTDFTDVQFSDRITNPTITITLREGFTTRNHVEIDFLLGRDDLNAIKLLSGLCTTRDNCWVRLPSFFINDIGMNPFLHSNFEPDAQASFHQPLGFINDITSPTVVIFDADIDQGVVSLSFSEVVVSSSFFPDDITLLEAPGGNIMVQLSSETPFNRSARGDQIFFSFTGTNLNTIKALDLFTAASNSYLSLVSSHLVDTSGNVVEELTTSDPLQVSAFSPDLSQPNLVTFDLYNNDNGSLIISFDEPVDVNLFNIAEITLISGALGFSSFSYTITGGTVSYLTQAQLSLLITVTPTDLRNIKLMTDLATGRENTYISISSSLVTDTNGNSVVGVPLSAPLQLRSNGFVSDSSRASLIGYTFDLNTATISMTFTDVLDASTLDLTQLTLQNSRTDPTETYTLVDSSASLANSDNFDISLSAQDLQAIQFNLQLAGSETSTFLSFVSSLVRDVSGLEVIPVASSGAIGPTSYIPDMTPPMLLSFSLDMDAAELSVTFSEPIKVSTIVLSSLTLQDTIMATPSESYTLTNGSFTEEEETAISVLITLTYSDLNMIKRLSDLASSMDNTHISIPRDFVTDTNDNQIQPLIVQVSSYVEDTTRPVLLFFDLSFTQAGEIRLRFSEAITYSGDIQMTVVLLNTPFNPSVSKVLTAEDAISTLQELDTVTIVPNGNLLLELTTNPNIATSTATLYLSISEGGFRDFAGNNIVPIPSVNALQVRYICKWARAYCRLELQATFPFSHTLNSSTCPGEIQDLYSVQGNITLFTYSRLNGVVFTPPFSRRGALPCLLTCTYIFRTSK